MADGGRYYSPRFNNPNLSNIKSNYTKNNASKLREVFHTPSISKLTDISDGNRGTSEHYRHQFKAASVCTADGASGSYSQHGQMNSNDLYINRNMPSTCNASHGYNTHMNSVYPNVNNMSNPNSHGQGISHEHQRLPSLSPAHQMAPFGGMMLPGTGNHMQSNSFPQTFYAQNQMYTGKRQALNNTGIPYPPPMYNTHSNMCMPPPPPPLPSSLPLNNQTSYENQLVLTPMQSSKVLPANQAQDAGQAEQHADQEWVNRFVEERKYTLKEKEKKPKFKVVESRRILQRWLHLLDKLALERDKLIDLIKCGESEWKREIQRINFLKEKLCDTQKEFSTQVDIDSLNTELEKKRKKRQWQAKRNQILAQEKLESKKKKFELHLKIDQWREEEIAKDQAKFKAASMKQEAGGVLGEVRRKQNDSSKSLNLLHALSKLRNFRKQEAELKGVYPKPSSEQNKHFDDQMMFLEKVMKKHHELYESEEKTLVVMLAEEEEEKERERREKNQREQLAQAASLESSDPMQDFYRYYTQADNGLDSLIHIRHVWDMYIVPESIPGASCIPQGTITAVEPSSDKWAKILKDKG